jgi:hypothetical protein
LLSYQYLASDYHIRRTDRTHDRVNTNGFWMELRTLREQDLYTSRPIFGKVITARYAMVPFLTPHGDHQRYIHADNGCCPLLLRHAFVQHYKW